MPWRMVGGHPVVTEGSQTDLFFLLYLLVGMALPLAWLVAYRYIMKRWGQSLGYGRFLNARSVQNAVLSSFSFILLVLKFTVKGIHLVALAVWNGIKGFLQGIKDIIIASNPKDE